MNMSSMTTELMVTLLEKGSDSWNADIDCLRKLLGSPNNPYLFPPHYLKATFPNSGGQVAVFKQDQSVVGVGFLFPRSLRADARVFTLRFHRAGQDLVIDPQRLTAQIEQLLGSGRVVYYDPTARQQYDQTSWQIDAIEVGRPDEKEAWEIRNLQQEIWGSDEDFLYPADIHSRGFCMGSSLVARSAGKPIGFLFGLNKFSGSEVPDTWHQRYRGDFRLESQLLGVLPAHRHSGIGEILKRAQAELARKEGVHIVNWTVDPLQFGNAILNFAKLKAVAFDFYPNYYQFRNRANQVTASRLGITWLVDSERVKLGLSNSSDVPILNLGADAGIQRVNDAWTTLDLDNNSHTIAIEVPSDWTDLQGRDVQQAQKWRETTDRLFHRYLGCEEGKYMITMVAQDRAKRFLIAERIDPALLRRLAR